MPNVVSFYRLVDSISKQTVLKTIADTNYLSQRFGLSLSEREAAEIIATRDQVLKNMGRVELSFETTNKLIVAFCDSPYINQADYASTICELLEIYYYVKNETLDDIGDDDLIHFMKDCFNNRCFGSIELLGEDIEILISEIRHHHYNFTSDDDKDEV